MVAVSYTYCEQISLANNTVAGSAALLEFTQASLQGSLFNIGVITSSGAATPTAIIIEADSSIGGDVSNSLLSGISTSGDIIGSVDGIAVENSMIGGSMSINGSLDK